MYIVVYRCTGFSTGMIVIDKNGIVAGGTSTNGVGFKVPG